MIIYTLAARALMGVTNKVAHSIHKLKIGTDLMVNKPERKLVRIGLLVSDDEWKEIARSRAVQDAYDRANALTQAGV